MKRCKIDVPCVDTENAWVPGYLALAGVSLVDSSIMLRPRQMKMLFLTVDVPDDKVGQIKAVLAFLEIGWQ